MKTLPLRRWTLWHVFWVFLGLLLVAWGISWLWTSLFGGHPSSTGFYCFVAAWLSVGFGKSLGLLAFMAGVLVLLFSRNRGLGISLLAVGIALSSLLGLLDYFFGIATACR